MNLKAFNDAGDDGNAKISKSVGLPMRKIMKGSLNDAPLKLNPASIPAKHERNIHRHHVKPAFGDSTSRFLKLTDSSALVPGPGNYDPNAFKTKIDSKKGSGFFASTTKLHRLERTRSHIPGPGTYKIMLNKPSKPKKGKSRRNTSGLSSSHGSTAVMSCQLQSRNLFKSDIENSIVKPGVGAYELSPNKMIKSKSAYSTFKSKIQRFVAQQEEGPGVGSYNLNTLKSQHHRPSKKAQPKMQSDNKIEQNLKKAIMILDNLQKKQKLGPGSYEMPSFKTTKSFKINQTIYDRFGQLKPIYNISSTPIPEISNPQNIVILPEFSPSKSYNSIFKSATTRSDIKLTNQMDPGTYNNLNKSLSKKSHLINFMKKWV